MTQPSFIERLRRSSMVRALIVYLAAAWIVLEVTATLEEILGLPDWTAAVAFVLLLSGLVVILATAWVQSQPGLEAREEAGEVPDSWDVELKDFGQSLRQGRLPHLTWGRAIMGGAVVFALLFGLAFGYVLFSPDAPRPGPAPLAAEATAAPGVAVVPFSVSGPELDLWREGLVDLLATNLDGLGGLRGIDSRTVLARWSDAVPAETRPDLDTMLGVARAAEARWVLIGSVVGADRIRLAADVYDLDTGMKLGTARAEGGADEMMSLVDELSVEVAGLLLDRDAGDGGFPHVSSVTTTSLPALEAYLQGEAHFRHAEYEEAIRRYNAAVAEDSTFALAWMRLNDAYGWTEVGGEAYNESAERADLYRDRLPAREKLLVRSHAAFSRGTLAVLPEMETAARRYPDDPEIVYEVAEYYMHFGGLAVPSLDSILATFEKAIALDPTFGPYYTHTVDLAIALGDSVRAAELLEAQGRVAPTDRHHVGSQVAFDLVFGTEEIRDAAWARHEARPLASAWASVSLAGPGHAGLREKVAEIALATGAEFSEGGYAEALQSQGRLHAAATFLDDRSPVALAGQALVLRVAGLPVSLEAWRPPSPDSTASPSALMFLGIAAIEGDPAAPSLDAVLAEADGRRQAADAVGDAVEAGRWAALAGALEAYATWNAGDARAALPELEDALAGMPAWVPGVNEWIPPANAVRWWLGVASEELGRLDQATQHFQRFYFVPVLDALAQYRLGDLYERLNRPEDARRAYAAFVDAWQNADPELQPVVERGRARLAALIREG